MNNSAFNKIDAALDFVCELHPNLCLRQLFTTIGVFVLCVFILFCPCFTKGLFTLVYRFIRYILSAACNVMRYGTVRTAEQ